MTPLLIVMFCLVVLIFALLVGSIFDFSAFEKHFDSRMDILEGDHDELEELILRRTSRAEPSSSGALQSRPRTYTSPGLLSEAESYARAKAGGQEISAIIHDLEQLLIRAYIQQGSVPDVYGPETTSPSLTATGYRELGSQWGNLSVAPVETEDDPHFTFQENTYYPGQAVSALHDPLGLLRHGYPLASVPQTRPAGLRSAPSEEVE